MNILILTQFYPPEVGAAAVRLGRLARLLAADGHRVTVLTSMPNYPQGVINPPYRRKVFRRETIDGVDVRRVWVYATPSKRARARLLNQFSFMMMSALRGLLLRRPDVILVESHPLFACISGGVIQRFRRAPVVLNVSDLWPESAVAVGALRADSLIVRVAARVERWAYRDAALIVGMTQGVVDGILAAGADPARVALIQNAVDLERFRPNPRDRTVMRAEWGVGGRFTVVHVGNMSLTYDFDTILAVARRCSDFEFVFVGDGSQAAHIRERVAALALRNVRLVGLLPHDQMPAAWAAADACVIALADHAIAGGTRPAKMFEAFAAGVPVVAAIRGEGESLLRESGGGISVPIGDAEAMASALRSLAANPDERTGYARAGRAYAEAHLDPQHTADAYLERLRAATAARKRRK